MSRSGEETIPPDDSTQSRPDPLPTSPEDSAGDTVAVTPMENSGNPSGAGTVSEVVSKPQASLESVNPLRADEQQFGGPSPSQGGSEATSSEPPAPAGSAPGVTSSDHAEIPPSASPGAAEELNPTHRPPSESGAFSESIAPAVSGQPVARQAVPSTPYTEAAAPSPSSTPDPEETPAVETIASHTKTEAVAKEPELDYDPVAENGTFFNGWEDPRLVLVFTGCQDGYLEPCGCAGLAKMKGGLSRRYTFFEGLEKLGWPVLALDVGGLIKGFGRQAELKFQLTNEAMRQMDYDAIGLGESDLKLPAGELLTVTANMPENPSPFVSANVAVYAFDPTMTAPYKILGINGLKIGVTSVLGDHHRQAVSNPDVMMAEAEESIRDVLPKLKEARCNLLVLLSHASAKQTKDLANMFPEFRIVATADTPPEPPLKPKMINGDQYYLEVGEKGKYAVVVGIFNDEDPQKRVRYQRVALDSRYANSPEILQLMADYQAQLKADGFEGLGIRPVPLAKSELMGTFVGSRACENCHEDEYEIWEDSGHAHAWHSIVEISKPSREFDPECISCHVIGWHPTEYFPYESGFLGVKETPHLKNVGCESCHGPGEEHIKAEEHGDVATQERLREAVRLPMREAEKFCYRCHDLDNSPAFDFETYWPKVDHRLFKD
jgi:hypothetical protein